MIQECSDPMYFLMLFLWLYTGCFVTGTFILELQNRNRMQ